MTMAPSYALSEVKGKAAEQAGAILFRDKGCAYCHGPAGQGTAKGPSLADLRKTWTAPRVTAQIQNGGQKMPAFGDSLTHDEVQQLVAYLRAKHPHTPPPAPTSAPMINPGQ
jgi:mono/diheme cytochrome c family protein